jgi:flagellar biosynthesis protein FlhF
MQLKRYRSATVREALALARADLGPAALVLSTRLVSARGVRGWLGSRVVEVTAAWDGYVSEIRPEEDVDRPAGAGSGTDAPDPEPETVQTLKPWEASLAARLCATGLDRALAADIACAFPRWRRRDVSVTSLRHAIAERLQPVAAGGESHAPAEVFIGPPGVGKTTTIAKIAARGRVRDGARPTLVAGDGFRVGAVEQLRIFADIIGSPFLVARTPEELDRVLSAATGHVLVDTAGRSPRDSAASGLFDVIASRPGVRTHLVLPAGSSRRDAERAVEAFGQAAPARAVLTRVDEADSLAPIVCLLRDRGLRISYLGTGQRVPEDLELATAPALAAHILGAAVTGEQA